MHCVTCIHRVVAARYPYTGIHIKCGSGTRCSLSVGVLFAGQARSRETAGRSDQVYIGTYLQCIYIPTGILFVVVIYDRKFTTLYITYVPIYNYNLYCVRYSVAAGNGVLLLYYCCSRYTIYMVRYCAYIRVLF